ncbi:hypothetical protein ACFSUD_05035 [Sulfitobacter aestuarii]|uniref:Uncharacterized protein n=1 Tax=Sulfitobacter aestuarii TaxID=2161676 RepID=A0ABW5TZI4_9RHOB
MHPELEIRRRLVFHASQTYARSDAEWHKGLEHAAEMVPDVAGHGYWQIGNPGSEIRRLYERRAAALSRFDAARQKLQVAKDRLHERDVAAHPFGPARLTHHDNLL